MGGGRRVRWAKDGLDKPPEVERAGSSWREESDQIGRFVAECCVVGDFAQAKGRQLYHAYVTWVEGAGERPVTEKTFGTRISETYSKQHKEDGWVYAGIGHKNV
jgi:putative DNA primase/helicase